MSKRNDLAVAAREYLERAFEVLKNEHVLPVSPYKRHLRVGTDYFGFLDQRAHDALESAIVEMHPRFSSQTRLGERDFANSYISSFLEACIATLARTGEGRLGCDPTADTQVDDLIEELRSRVATADADMVCMRLVTHLETQDNQPLDLGPVVVHPVVAESPNWRRTTAGIFEWAIFGSGELVDSKAPIPHAQPSSIIWLFLPEVGVTDSPG